MKKRALFSVIFTTIFCSIIPFKQQPIILNAESEDGYVEINDEPIVESRFTVVTHSPWETDTKLLFSFDEAQINKAYLVFDYDVTLSKNNPELVTKLGVNGSYFKGAESDGKSFHGSKVDVMKNYGNWFFLPTGRNQVYLPIEEFMSDVENVNQFGLFFDTGFADRSGSSIDIYGLYLADNFDDKSLNNLIDPANYSDDDAKITKNGVDLSIQSNEGDDAINGAWLNGDYVGSLKMHVKSAREGGKAIDTPNEDYGFISITLNETKDISSDEGFAFSVFAPDGETYFKVILEDEDGYFFVPKFSGGTIENAGHYPMIPIDGSPILSILHFYGALYMSSRDSGTVYIPYSQFVGVDHMFGEDKPLPTGRVQNIKKIHVGMDMKYGLGRNLVINEFGTCDADAETITSILQLSKMSDEEWDRLHFFQSHNLTINGSEDHKNNYVTSVIDEDHVPGSKPEVDVSDLENAIALAKSLNKKDYTTESWKHFETKLENAENILEYSFLYEQEDCDKATSELLLAIRRLTPISSNNKGWVMPVVIAASVVGGLALVFGGLVITGFIIGGNAFAVFTGKRKNRGKKDEK